MNEYLVAIALATTGAVMLADQWTKGLAAIVCWMGEWYFAAIFATIAAYATARWLGAPTLFMLPGTLIGLLAVCIIARIWQEPREAIRTAAAAIAILAVWAVFQW